MSSIPYTVKESARAKRVKLQISPRDGVIVVIPRGFQRARIPGLIRQRQDWIEKHLRDFARQREQNPRHDEFPPKALHLRAIHQTWHCRYEAAPRLALREVVSGELLLQGPAEDRAGLQAILHHWLSAQARQHLIPKLDELSRLAGLPYNRALVKCQKTRWGSCSGRGNINLNYKLLFLPAPMARYVLLHELAHTRHLNHSADFWGLVETLEPDWRQLDKALDEGWRYVPEWVGSE